MITYRKLRRQQRLELDWFVTNSKHESWLDYERLVGGEGIDGRPQSLTEAEEVLECIRHHKPGWRDTDLTPLVDALKFMCGEAQRLRAEDPDAFAERFNPESMQGVVMNMVNKESRGPLRLEHSIPKEFWSLSLLRSRSGRTAHENAPSDDEIIEVVDELVTGGNWKRYVIRRVASKPVAQCPEALAIDASEVLRSRGFNSCSKSHIQDRVRDLIDRERLSLPARITNPA